jgi:hypothetical protein
MHPEVETRYLLKARTHQGYFIAIRTLDSNETFHIAKYGVFLQLK